MSTHGYLDEETRGMVGPVAPDQRVGWRRRVAAARLRPFLQHRLGIAHIAIEGAKRIAPVTLNEPPRRLQAAVEVKRRDDGFACTRENCRLAPSATARLRIGKDELIGKASDLGRFGAGLLAHQRIELQRQRALRIAGIESMQLFSRDHAQYAIAQKFQPLVRRRRIRTGMSERATKEFAIGENVTQPRFEVSR